MGFELYSKMNYELGKSVYVQKDSNKDGKPEVSGLFSSTTYNPLFEAFDFGSDGNDDYTKSYDLNGNLTYESFDIDSNGVEDYARSYDENGNVSFEHYYSNDPNNNQERKLTFAEKLANLFGKKNDVQKQADDIAAKASKNSIDREVVMKAVELENVAAGEAAFKALG